MALDRRFTRAHKRRQSRRARIEVLGQEALCARLGVEPEDLIEALTRLAIPYYEDAQGGIWASLPAGAIERLPLPASD
ncbi:MAG: hypothetical protein AAF515_05585 [Pseudomonadota bacterium]